MSKFASLSELFLSFRPVKCFDTELQDVKSEESSDLQSSAAGTYSVSMFEVFFFLVISEERRICAKPTMLCFYSQDCGAAVRSVIIRPAEGDSSPHLTEQSVLTT